MKKRRCYGRIIQKRWWGLPAMDLASTWLKSGLTVKSNVMSLVNPIWRQAQHRPLKIFPLRTDCLLPLKSFGLGNHIGCISNCFCGLIPLMPCSSPIRWTYPAASAECVASEFSRLRKNLRCTLKLSCVLIFMAKRNRLNGILISAIQPSASMLVLSTRWDPNWHPNHRHCWKHIHRSLRPIPMWWMKKRFVYRNNYRWISTQSPSKLSLRDMRLTILLAQDHSIEKWRRSFGIVQKS